MILTILKDLLIIDRQLRQIFVGLYKVRLFIKDSLAFIECLWGDQYIRFAYC